MPLNDRYRRQVALLIAAVPFVAAEREFALKGGTAINLFVRDMPRLSVDIDLTFLPVAPRAESLAAIDAGMKRIAAALRTGLRGVRVNEVVNVREQIVTKLMVQGTDAQIKIEVTPVLRGCVFEPEVRVVSPTVEDAFGFAEMQVVSFSDLYAGKIMAALDRQHPRDLFDVRDLLANEGISDDLRRAFIVYLISHDRPISEVLVPRRKDIAQEFAQGFDGMTAEPVAFDALLATREELIAAMAGGMPDEHKEFLRGFKRGRPEWSLLGVPGAADLPAVRWKQLNLGKLTVEARARLIDQLEERLK
ncbi:nucleotidyl transferase AbiEii/AbiGii toxin family protein [Rhizobium ruizarguesonis]|uniref:nucleotidyl transferase AbiEii/AbiGii toxin family protein n=1 Tax=Rhizobium ruizarguesonis TaxID=2081791 RepID=UPI0003800B61|nr:nucleotidyl transferase AbiEii/AbiGii toxin family protein [Rhizobium ruizarguesonis]NEH75610.1 nucleotidyl transferase AbiEii/AbiGii toxin family protein [Rhizobium ruizarguesonis]NEI76637.1 nucleotidyl transferase AbiEii/AbiGii toxin family protein [Rhizobium ruizarguesonis]